MSGRRVLFFGDSFVAGTGDPPGLGWVGRVVAALFADGVPLTAYPLGIRGQSSVQVAARWRVEAQPRLDPTCDCRAVFSFGTNDDAQAIGFEQSVDVLASVLDEAAALRLGTFVVGPPPVGDARRDDRLAVLSSAFADVAADRAVAFVSVIDALRAAQSWTRAAAAGDGAHPSAPGYEKLARLVLDGGFVDWLR